MRPTTKIKQSDLQKWILYAGELQKYPLFQKYFEDLIIKLVTQLRNPLSVGLIRDMFDGEISDGALSSVISLIGEDNFKKICEELLSKTYSSQPAFEKEYFSLWGEVIAFRELLPDFPDLRKIDAIGDWKADDCTISVKTVLPLDLNHMIIKNVLLSLFYIEELTALSRYGYIRINDLQCADDKFVATVADVLGNHLDGILRILTAKTPEGHLELACPVPDGQRLLEINVDTYRAGKEVSVYIHEERGDSRSIQLYLEGAGKEGLSIRYNTDSYWTGTEIDWSTLDRKIDDKLVKFDNAVKSVSDPQKFVGCIPILVHPSHMDYLRSERKTIEDHVRKMIDGRTYPTVVFLSQQIPFHGHKTLRIKSSSFSSSSYRAVNREAGYGQDSQI